MAQTTPRLNETQSRTLAVAFCLLTFWTTVVLTAVVVPAASETGTSSQPGTDRTEMSVFVSIAPLAFFVERVGGDLVSVEVLVGPGQSPASFDPTPRQMARLAEARVFVGIGVPMEKLILPHIHRSFPQVAVVAAQAGILGQSPLGKPAPDHPDLPNPPDLPDLPDLQVRGDATEIQSADPGLAHRQDNGEPSAEGGGEGPGQDHGDLDPHIWLSPRLACTIARNICEGLTRLSPNYAAVFQHNLLELTAELEELDREIAQLLAPVAGKELIVFHPAYTYFAAEYGLRQVALEKGGLPPSPKHLASVLALAKQRGVQVVFVQPQFSEASVRKVAAEAGLRVRVLDPLSRDYLRNLLEMARTIRACLAPQ